MRKYMMPLLACLAIIFPACDDNELKEPVFEVSIAPSSIVDMDGDVYVCYKGNILFNFSGNPDLISFYSGESGKEYRYKDRYKLEGTPKMYFSKSVQLGPAAGTFAAQNAYDSLRVLISNVFPGITGDSLTDANNLLKENTWTDITDRFNVFVGSRKDPAYTIDSDTVDLSEFKDQPVKLAFRFKFSPATGQNTVFWIRNLRIFNETPEFTDVVLTTGTAAWAAFNFYTPNPYAVNDDTGSAANNSHRTWLLTSAATSDNIKIRGNTPAPGNDDWAISAPIELQSVSPDVSVAVKGFDDARDSYPYVYNTPGDYTVTFVATNSKYSETRSVTKEIKIRVIPNP